MQVCAASAVCSTAGDVHNSAGLSANKQWQMWIYYLRTSHYLLGMCPSSTAGVCERETEIIRADRSIDHSRHTKNSSRSSKKITFTSTQLHLNSQQLQFCLILQNRGKKTPKVCRNLLFQTHESLFKL